MTIPMVQQITIDTDADLQKIKDNLNALREKLDDKSEYRIWF